MKTLRVPLLCWLVGALAALGQQPVGDGLPAPTTLPASHSDDDDDGEPDGSMRRALAYSQRGLVRELLESPSTLAASSAADLAREVRIPEVHARLMIEAAVAGKPVAKLGELLQLGLPEGKVVPPGTKLDKLSGAELGKKLQLSQAEVQRFEVFRDSARRVHNRFRELRAIQESRRLGAELTSQAVARFLNGSGAERMRLVADALGYSAQPNGVSEARADQERRARELRAGEQVGQALAQFRDPQGRIDWKRVGASEIGGSASGFGQFAFALFLKELMVAAQSSDPERLSVFLDQVTSQEFLVDYTLFVAGARAADSLYGARARRYFKQGAMSGFLRTHFVLAAGLAVPSVARGEFQFETYGVDLLALSMSVTAVTGVTRLGRGALQLVAPGKRALLRGGRMLNVAGWVYQAGETAVVLWLSDPIANRIDRYLDERNLRNTIRGAEGRLQEFLGAGSEGGALGLDELERLLVEVDAAYQAARAHSTQPLFSSAHAHQGEVLAAVDALDEINAKAEEIRERLAEHPRLEATVGAAAAEESAQRIEALEAELARLNEAYTRSFGETMNQAYTGGVSPTEAPQPGSKLAAYEAQTQTLLDALDLVDDPQLRVSIVLQIEALRAEYTVEETLLSAARADLPVAEASAEASAAPVDGTSGLVDQLGGE
ncbi:MAG: hypothetical protein KDD82_03895 [Planctomycetes bacterium]|nr:hypothetical protein [Planctomycetota bacterium]